MGRWSHEGFRHFLINYWYLSYWKKFCCIQVSPLWRPFNPERCWNCRLSVNPLMISIGQSYRYLTAMYHLRPMGKMVDFPYTQRLNIQESQGGLVSLLAFIFDKRINVRFFKWNRFKFMLFRGQTKDILSLVHLERADNIRYFLVCNRFKKLAQLTEFQIPSDPSRQGQSLDYWMGLPIPQIVQRMHLQPHQQ